MVTSSNSEINDFKKRKLNEELITETSSSTELTIQLNINKQKQLNITTFFKNNESNHIGSMYTPTIKIMI